MLYEPFFGGIESTKAEMGEGVKDAFCALGFKASFLAAVFTLVKRSHISAYIIGDSFHNAKLRKFS
jgi:hypothetical protein